MTPKGISPNMLALALALASPFICSSCGKKAQIEYETARARQTMTELQIQARKIDSEVASTGNLGPYQQTTPGMVAELKNKISEAQKTIENLKAEKATAQEKTEGMQAETAAYRAKYRTL